MANKVGPKTLNEVAEIIAIEWDLVSEQGEKLDPGEVRRRQNALEFMAKRLADVLAPLNANFDRNRFLRSCKVLS